MMMMMMMKIPLRKTGSEGLLKYKYKIFKMGSNITWNMNCNYRIAAPQCTLKTSFVAGMCL
jgi:hypothetical protein